MVIRSLVHIIYFTLLISLPTFGQQLSSGISFNRSDVYVGQPVQVTVEVFTSTWFTKGVNPGNIKVNGAYTVYFRSLSTSKQINGKTHAGVQLFFNVFPYEDGVLEFPSLAIQIESPKDGGYKGIPQTVNTQPRSINVKSIPKGFNSDSWLVTNWMSVSENWSNTSNLKVGDVIERTIKRTVSNSVSELIPPVQWDSIPGVSQYPTRSEVKNNKTKTNISASRSEGTRYLLEKEGELIIPAIEFTWYDPYQKKLFKKTLPEKSLTIAPNPDLGMLASKKQELIADSQTTEDADSKSFRFLGLNLKQLTGLLVLLAIFGFVLRKLILILLRRYRLNQALYKVSEPYFFKEFLSSIEKGDDAQILTNFYIWLNYLPNKPKSAKELSESISTKHQNEIEKILQKTQAKKLNLSLKTWKKIRKELFTTPDVNKSSSSTWVNP